jgi:hypothetical protein
LKFRRRTNAAFVVLFLLLLLSTASFAIFAHVESHPVTSLKAYLGFAVGAVLTYLLAKNFDWQNRGQDYRALAEGLRVGCAWKLCGIPDFASQSYLLRQPADAKWIRDALAALERTAVQGEAPLYEPRSKAALKATILHWVRPELQYYADAGRNVEKWLTGFERSAIVLVAASVIVAILTSLREAPSSAAGAFVEEHFGGMLVLSTVLAVGAGLLDAFAEKRAWKEHGHRYKHMARFLRDLVEQLDNAEEDRTAQAIDVLQKVGQEELDENSEWLQTHRERPLDLTHLGG